MKWKYEADKNLIARTQFQWTILRPSSLNNDEGKGVGDMGRMHLGQSISVRIATFAASLLTDSWYSGMMSRWCLPCWSIDQMLLDSP